MVGWGEGEVMEEEGDGRGGVKGLIAKNININ